MQHGAQGGALSGSWSFRSLSTADPPLTFVRVALDVTKRWPPTFRCTIAGTTSSAMVCGKRLADRLSQQRSGEPR